MTVALAERVGWIVSHVEGKDVLDVGCVGAGTPYGHPKWLHGHIKSSARSIIGIDNNLEGIEELQRRGFDVIWANAETFVSNPKFDVVVAGEVLEHLSNPGLFLNRARDNLRPEGRLILTAPNARHLGIILDRVADTHVNCFTPNLLRQLLERHRFREIALRFFWDEPANVKGTLYTNLFVRFFPRFSFQFGVIAEKVER